MLLLMAHDDSDDSDDDDDDDDDMTEDLEWGLRSHQGATGSAALLATAVPCGGFLNPEEGASLCHPSLEESRGCLSFYNLHKDSSCA